MPNPENTSKNNQQGACPVEDQNEQKLQFESEDKLIAEQTREDLDEARAAAD